ncbi:hypothetical protein C8J57DRAFT_1479228 [Mycena rebaudengoi]|nr:hypothetical protein C8J57DRAFT_1479228 [Mycena rebaudengoi]
MCPPNYRHKFRISRFQLFRILSLRRHTCRPQRHLSGVVDALAPPSGDGEKQDAGMRAHSALLQRPVRPFTAVLGYFLFSTPSFLLCAYYYVPLFSCLPRIMAVENVRVVHRLHPDNFTVQYTFPIYPTPPAEAQNVTQSTYSMLMWRPPLHFPLPRGLKACQRRCAQKHIRITTPPEVASALRCHPPNLATIVFFSAAARHWSAYSFQDISQVFRSQTFLVSSRNLSLNVKCPIFLVSRFQGPEIAIFFRGAAQAKMSIFSPCTAACKAGGPGRQDRALAAAGDGRGRRQALRADEVSLWGAVCLRTAEKRSQNASEEEEERYKQEVPKTRSEPHAPRRRVDGRRMRRWRMELARYKSQCQWGAVGEERDVDSTRRVPVFAREIRVSNRIGNAVRRKVGKEKRTAASCKRRHSCQRKHQSAPGPRSNSHTMHADGSSSPFFVQLLTNDPRITVIKLENLTMAEASLGRRPIEGIMNEGD